MKKITIELRKGTKSKFGIFKEIWKNLKSKYVEELTFLRK